MASNVQKTPLVSSLNSFAAGKAAEALALAGKALPASVVKVTGQIVTVKFEVQDPTFTTLPNVMVPVIGSEYIRVPIQAGTSQKPGTLGVVIAIDAYIGGVSGLGGGVADLSQRGNLTTLVFVPIGNKNWPAVAPDAVVTYGVNGGGVTLLSDLTAQDVTFVLTKTGIAIKGNVTLKGNLSVTGNVSITGGLTATQDVVAGGISLMHHVHINGGGTGNSGPPA